MQDSSPRPDLLVTRPEPAPISEDERLTKPNALLETEWAQLGIQPTAFVLDEGGTIVPTQAPLPATVTSDEAFEAGLASAGNPQPLPEGPAVALGGVLGRGGMGVVYEGTQRSLNRSVAVKTAHKEAGPVGVLGLLREAWVGGHLEHPNVVPVHDVVREDDGPLIVMKRIEGTSWFDELAAMRKRPEAERDEESQLRVLLQLAHAVHFAHTRGFVHLDLKPANVMIGAFGEIYLVDWGVAASLDPDRPPFVPYVREIRSVVGTPGYMSPEQAVGDGTGVDARTDVYLLGAVLFELLVGRPPHLGPSMMEALVSAFASLPPELPERVPDELAAICRRAMAREPDDRFQSAEAFRVALAEYLVHADSHRLVADAQQQLTALRERFAGDEADEAGLQAVVGEARFGLKRALQLWPDNAAARTTLQELLVLVIERALDQGRWPIVAGLAAELPDPRPDLVARAAALERDQSAQAAELEQFKRDADLTHASRMRTMMAWLGGTAWLVTNAGLGLLDKLDVFSVGYPHLIGVAGAATVIWTLIVALGRATLLGNVINRQVVGAFSVGWPIATAFWVGAFAMDVPFAAATVLIMQLMLLALAIIVVAFDRRLLAVTAGAWVVATLMPLAPQWGLEAIGVGGFVTLVAYGRQWARDARAPA